MSIKASLPQPGSSQVPGGSNTLPANRALWSIILTFTGIVALVWSEIWISTAASIWAFVEVLHLGGIGYAVFAVPLVPIALWASWQTARFAWIGERYHAGE